MDKIALFKSLIEEAKVLPYNDMGKFDHLQQRSEMVIKRVYGEDHVYFDQLKYLMAPLRYPRSEYEFYRDRTQFSNFLETLCEEIEAFGEPDVTEPSNDVTPTQPEQNPLSNRIFVVHGHDEAMKLGVARALEKLGLVPIILHEQASQGKTIIEKFEEFSDVGFAVALLSADDKGYVKTASPEQAQPRARQNVIFELGYFVGKLGRQRVLVLYQPGVEIPSDYQGVLYTLYDRPDGGWRYELVRELKTCGYEIDANKLL